MCAIVVANILADVIIPLAAVITENLKKDGIYIVSGIINTKKKSSSSFIQSLYHTRNKPNGRLGEF